MFKRTKKGMSTLSVLPGLVIALVIAFFVLGIGAVLLSNFGAQTTVNSTAYNVTQQGQSGLAAVASQGSTMGYVVVLVVVVGLLAGLYFLNKR